MAHRPGIEGLILLFARDFGAFSVRIVIVPRYRDGVEARDYPAGCGLMPLKLPA